MKDSFGIFYLFVSIFVQKFCNRRALLDSRKLKQLKTSAERKKSNYLKQSLTRKTKDEAFFNLTQIKVETVNKVGPDCS